MTSDSVSQTQGISLDGLGRIGMVLARLIIGYLWITQLGWKMPPDFGCPADFAVSTSLSARTSGLCDWTGLMAVYSKVPAQAAFLKNIVIPNISWLGWGVWLLEVVIAGSLVFGLLSRFGALLGFLQAVNLYIGLTAIPFEWYWTYGMLITLHLIFFCVPPGRFYGLDAWLRPRLQAAASSGTGFARFLLWLT